MGACGPFVGNPNLPFTWFRGRESNFFQAVFQTLHESFLLSGERDGSGIMGLLVGVFRLADEVLRSGSEIAVRGPRAGAGRLERSRF